MEPNINSNETVILTELEAISDRLALIEQMQTEHHNQLKKTHDYVSEFVSTKLQPVLDEILPTINALAESPMLRMILGKKK